MNEWQKFPDHIPPEGVLLDTKLDDERGLRNEQSLQFDSNLWWIPNKGMYVYYTPTHWRLKEVS